MSDRIREEFEGARVLILTGTAAGNEGTCLGKADNGAWAISPDESNAILELRYPDEFGLLINLSTDPERN